MRIKGTNSQSSTCYMLPLVHAARRQKSMSTRTGSQRDTKTHTRTITIGETLPSMRFRVDLLRYIQAGRERRQDTARPTDRWRRINRISKKGKATSSGYACWIRCRSNQSRIESPATSHSNSPACACRPKACTYYVYACPCIL